jgi:hypothetical protein
LSYFFLVCRSVFAQIFPSSQSMRESNTSTKVSYRIHWFLGRSRSEIMKENEIAKMCCCLYPFFGKGFFSEIRSRFGVTNKKLQHNVNNINAPFLFILTSKIFTSRTSLDPVDVARTTISCRIFFFVLIDPKKLDSAEENFKLQKFKKKSIIKFHK